MSEEEFQESEVIFSDNNNSITHEDVDDGGYFNYKSEKNTRHHKNNNNNNSITHEDVDDGGYFNYKSQKNTRHHKNNNNKVVVTASSVPVIIPRHHGSVFHFDFEELDDDNLVPPHVISERRIAGKMAFSVCTGNGRTLKGRDLSQVRNSVLRLTGFLEA